MSTATDPLAVLGIRVTEPVGEPRRDGAWMLIGSLVTEDDGPVEVIPHRGISTSDHSRLIAAATQVWLHGRAGFSPEGWTYYSRLGWVTDVWVRDRPASRPACGLGVAVLQLEAALIRARHSPSEGGDLARQH